MIFGTSQRLPPANHQAEQSLLGALLANNKAFERVAEFLLPHHFADPVHGKIFAAIAREIDQGRVADPISLKAQFQNDDDLSGVGGVAYLANLLAAMVGIINAGDYGRAILDAWVRRELIGVTEEFHNLAFAPDGALTGMQMLEELESALQRIAEGAGDVAPVTPAGEAVAQALAMTQAAADRVSGLAGITTGYGALDRMMSGLQPQKMILLAARPSMGKTGLALGIAARAAASGVPVLFWSGEMGAPQLGARMGAAHARINTVSVFSGRKYDPHPDAQSHRAALLDDAEWSRLVAGERAARRLPLFFDDRAALTVQALRARVRRMKRTHKLGLVVVDYVGLMRATAETVRRPLYEQATEISKALKAMSMEMGLPVLVCAQLNRQNESREDKMPQLSDLRDSGALEQDADTVMFIHRPHYYLSRAGEPVRRDKESNEDFSNRAERWRQQLQGAEGMAQISVAKNRQGPTGLTRLRFQDFTTWFFDEREADDAAAWADDLLGGA